MYTTTHYSLNIVEGTDVVNPLVQQNPNFEAIDAAMFANKQASVGSATELTAGTVHTITRANTDSNYIRFTATSDWLAGDSMVIDSTPVSVFLSDGTAPKTGAYKINTEVLLLLNGTRVTMLVSESTALDVANAAKANADDALDILHGEVVATVTADGIKNNGQIYAALFALIDFSKLTLRSVLVIGTQVWTLKSIGANYLTFSRLNTGSTGGNIIELTISASPARYAVVFTTAPGISVLDEIATVPSNGVVHTIYA